MSLPPRLRRGEVVGVVAPSGSFEPEQLQPALAYLKARGFEVREGEALYRRDRYLAGFDEDRARDVNRMFTDRDIRAIFVARGGYGSARVLGLLDWEAIAENPKALVGFSDTTALQLGIFARTGLVSLSGVSLSTDIGEAGLHRQTEETLWDALTRAQFRNVAGLQALNPGEASGPLVGGCLSLVATLLGTAYFPDLSGAVLFLEDVNEAPYRVDRMLNQLRMAGVFDRVAGVVFGQFEGCEPDRIEEGTVSDVLADLAGQVPCPVYTGLPYGHGPGRQVLPIGVAVRITEGQLVFEEDILS